MPIERPFSESDWLATPEPVRRYVESLAQRIEQLESRLNQNSQNSSKSFFGSTLSAPGAGI